MITLLLTGPPGVGKTTIIRAIAASLASRRLAGFYTEEIRTGQERVGFRLATFDGRERVMAHVELRGPRVGKYGVDIAILDEVTESALALDSSIDLYIVDEIGKMECLSGSFVGTMRRLLDARRPLIATIAQRGGGFIAEVKARRDVQIWEVTRANRDALPNRIAERLSLS